MIKKFLSIALAAAICSGCLSMNCAGVNYWSNNITTSAQAVESDCVVSINAYCSDTNSYLSNMNYKIKSSSGSYIAFSQANNVYKVTAIGGSTEIKTDSSGGLTVELPSGLYTLEVSGDDTYEPYNSTINFSVSAGAATKNLDVDYISTQCIINVSCVNDDGNNVSGATFQVKDSTGNTLSFISQDNSYVYVETTGKSILSTTETATVVSGLSAGNYTIEFLSCPDGYDMTQTVYSAKVDKGETESLNVSLITQNGQMYVSNVDANGQILAGSSCALIGSDNITLTFTKISDTEYKYDTAGLVNNIVFVENEPILITNLPIGVELTINEINTTEGYVLADPQKITLLDSDLQAVELVTKSTTGTLSIIVTDDTSKDPVEGFTYIITSKDSNVPLSFSLEDSQVLNTAYVYDESGSVTGLASGSLGIINVKGLPAGDYVIKCSESPNGYVNNGEKIEQSITANVVETLNISVSKSNVAIEVIDENEMPIQDVTVEIYNDSGEIALTGTTNVKGKILLSNVSQGSYTYRISSVPEGYSYDDTVQSFTILSNGTADGLSAITLSKVKIQVSIGAQIGDNSLENGVFVLYDSDGNEVSRALTSSAGVATFTGVGYGSYTIRQISAPIGYTVSKLVLEIDVDQTYMNEGIYDFSSDTLTSTGNEDASDDEDEDDDETQSSGSSFNIGDLFFVIIGVLIGAFVLVSVIMLVLKVKESKKQSIVTADKSSAQNDTDSDIKIYTPHNKSTTHHLKK